MLSYCLYLSGGCCCWSLRLSHIPQASGHGLPPVRARPLSSQDTGPRCQQEMQAQDAGGCQDTSPDAQCLFVPLKTTKEVSPFTVQRCPDKDDAKSVGRLRLLQYRNSQNQMFKLRCCSSIRAPVPLLSGAVCKSIYNALNVSITAWVSRSCLGSGPMP